MKGGFLKSMLSKGTGGKKQPFSIFQTLVENSLFAVAMESLQTPVVARGPKELENIQRALNKIKFLTDAAKEQGPEFMTAASKVAKYEKFEKGELVFPYGDVGSKFYVILKGSVGIWVPTKKLDKPVRQVQKKHTLAQRRESKETRESRRSSLTISGPSGSARSDRRSMIPNMGANQNPQGSSGGPRRSQLVAGTTGMQIPADRKDQGDVIQEQNESDEEEEEIIKESKQEGVPNVVKDDYEWECSEVVVFKAGLSFGELALLKDKPRAATIKCKEECHFAVMEKTDYQQLIGRIQAKKLDQFIHFLQNRPLFSNWTKTLLSKLTYYFETKKYMRKQVIFRKGDLAHKFYLIKTGEVKFLKDARENWEPGSDLQTNGLNSDGKAATSESLRKKPKPFAKNLELYSLGEGEVFGYEEILSNTPRSSYCFCMSTEAEIYEMDAEEFRNRILFVKTSKEFIYNKYETTQGWLTNRLNRISNQFKENERMLGENQVREDLEEIMKDNDENYQRRADEYFRQKERENENFTMAIPFEPKYLRKALGSSKKDARNSLFPGSSTAPGGSTRPRPKRAQTVRLKALTMVDSSKPNNRKQFSTLLDDLGRRFGNTTTNAGQTRPLLLSTDTTTTTTTTVTNRAKEGGAGGSRSMSIFNLTAVTKLKDGEGATQNTEQSPGGGRYSTTGLSTAGSNFTEGSLGTRADRLIFRNTEESPRGGVHERIQEEDQEASRIGIGASGEVTPASGVKRGNESSDYRGVDESTKDSDFGKNKLGLSPEKSPERGRRRPGRESSTGNSVRPYSAANMREFGIASPREKRGKMVGDESAEKIRQLLDYSKKIDTSLLRNPALRIRDILLEEQNGQSADRSGRGQGPSSMLSHTTGFNTYRDFKQVHNDPLRSSSKNSKRKIKSGDWSTASRTEPMRSSIQEAGKRRELTKSRNSASVIDTANLDSEPQNGNSPSIVDAKRRVPRTVVPLDHDELSARQNGMFIGDTMSTQLSKLMSPSTTVHTTKTRNSIIDTPETFATFSNSGHHRNAGSLSNPLYKTSNTLTGGSLTVSDRQSLVRSQDQTRGLRRDYSSSALSSVSGKSESGRRGFSKPGSSRGSITMISPKNVQESNQNIAKMKEKYGFTYQNYGSNKTVEGVKNLKTDFLTIQGGLKKH